MIAAVLMAAALALSGDEAPEARLTNVDIVRMTARGMSPDAIVEAIRKAPTTAFDMDPEIVLELRRAGVNDKVIEAMRKATPAPETPAPSPPSAPPAVLIELRFEGEAPDKPARVEAPPVDLQLRPVKLGFFLACLDPLHVPDTWMGSPMAGAIPRHRLLWFTDATRTVEVQGSKPRAVLDLPPSVKVEVEAGRHPVMTGLAVWSQESGWALLAAGEGYLDVAAGAPLTLAVKAHGTPSRRLRLPDYACELVRADPAGALTEAKKIFLQGAP